MRSTWTAWSTNPLLRQWSWMKRRTWWNLDLLLEEPLVLQEILVAQAMRPLPAGQAMRLLARALAKAKGLDLRAAIAS